MASLADLLRETREKRGLAVAEVAIETRIRDKIILALEAGDYKQLPPEPFIRGLLRNYARVLGLEPDLVLDTYAIETGLRVAPAPPSKTLVSGSQRGVRDQSALHSTPKPEPIFVLPPPTSKPEDSGNVGSSERPRDTPSFLSLILPFRNQAESQANGPIRLEASLQPSTSTQVVTTQEPGRSFAQESQPIFKVAPEALEDVSPIPDQVVWIHRLSASRLPEFVAALALAVAILALAGFGYARFFVSESSPSQIASRVNTRTPTATVQETTTRFPTPVPTFESTGGSGISPGLATAIVIPSSPVAPVALIPGDAQMDIEISAGGSPIWAWIVVDDLEVFKGNIQNDDKTFIARQRLYIQIKDLPNGTVTFEGKSILARVFSERKVLERAWQIDSNGAAVPVEAVPFLPSTTPRPTRTATATSTVTPSTTPTSSSTPSPTATMTPTATNSPTPIPTETQSPAPTYSPTTTATEPASAAPDPCSGAHGVQC
jgi:cytoskeletal protein RodZ